MMKQSPSNEGPKLRGVLRLLGYLTVLGAASGAWLLHSAHAELGERALMVGRELHQMRGNELGITRLTVNGARMGLSSVSTSQSVNDVVERFARACQEAAPDIQQGIREAKAHGARLPDAQSFGVLRSVPGEKEGTAACFASPKRDGLRGLLARLEQAMDDEDLSALGQVRYVYAKRTDDGRRTHVITTWSEGSLKLGTMFPDRGDAPGEDLVKGVRPPQSRRLLSAYGDDRKLHMVVYEAESSKEPAALLGSYQDALVVQGYRSEVEDALRAGAPLDTRVFNKDDREQLLVMSDRRDGLSRLFAFRIPTNGNVLLTR